MKLGVAVVLLAMAAPVAAVSGCRRSAAATGATSAGGPRAAAADDCAGHAVCTDDYALDAAVPKGCAAGASCSVTITLVAKREFHVNDDYPFRFNADEAGGVRFEGTAAAGKNVFSKPAGDWQKLDAKSGVMKVTFVPLAKGRTTIAGLFKLSVCSPERCLLEAQRISADVVAD